MRWSLFERRITYGVAMQKTWLRLDAQLSQLGKRCMFIHKNFPESGE